MSVFFLFLTLEHMTCCCYFCNSWVLITDYLNLKCCDLFSTVDMLLWATEFVLVFVYRCLFQLFDCLKLTIDNDNDEFCVCEGVVVVELLWNCSTIWVGVHVLTVYCLLISVIAQCTQYNGCLFQLFDSLKCKFYLHYFDCCLLQWYHIVKSSFFKLSTVWFCVLTTFFYFIRYWLGCSGSFFYWLLLFNGLFCCLYCCWYCVHDVVLVSYNLFLIDFFCVPNAQ